MNPANLLDIRPIYKSVFLLVLLIFHLIDLMLVRYRKRNVLANSTLYKDNLFWVWFIIELITVEASVLKLLAFGNSNGFVFFYFCR